MLWSREHSASPTLAKEISLRRIGLQGSAWLRGLSAAGASCLRSPHRRAVGTPSPLGPARRWWTVPGAVTDASPRLPGSGRCLGSHGALGARAPPAAPATARAFNRSGEGAHLPALSAPGLKTGAGRGGDTGNPGEGRKGTGEAPGGDKQSSRRERRGGEGTRSRRGIGKPWSRVWREQRKSRHNRQERGRGSSGRGRREVTQKALERGAQGAGVLGGGVGGAPSPRGLPRPVLERRDPWVLPAALGSPRPSGYLFLHLGLQICGKSHVHDF